jgi:hypothetical protein
MAFAGIFCIAELVRYFVWYFKAKKAAELEERFIDTKSTSTYTKIFLGFLVILMLYSILQGNILVGAVIIGYTILIFAIVLGVKNVLKENGVSAGINRTVTLISCYVVSLIVTSIVTFFIFRNIEPQKNYPDEIPLSIEDIAMMRPEEYSIEKNIKESSSLRELSVRQENLDYNKEAPELSYAIIDVKIAAVYDSCVNYFLREASRYDDDMEYREVQDEIWGANTVYRLYEGSEYMDTYLLCYEHRIVRISLYDFDTEKNPAFAKIISEKVKPN